MNVIPGRERSARTRNPAAFVEFILDSGSGALRRPGMTVALDLLPGILYKPAFKPTFRGI